MVISVSTYRLRPDLHCLRVTCVEPPNNELDHAAKTWATTKLFVAAQSGCQNINNKARGLALWQRSLAKASGLGLGGKLNPPTQFAAADKGRQNAQSEGLGGSGWAGRGN
jgi:hypothetical protein